eukprot:CAMPEP_0174927258 /NCGR_PEP_ID=MMETSP1355-20121228/18039_1 /TAXON_ID=464990 /ORGANISM="Hemiselmis tepida, Strain CCMP443" /LENGTH=123 /DNA_ID=CAMNT_0016173349 /DNA_START=38 /DNA_END=406 /DNA_ORIENTATION=-
MASSTPPSPSASGRLKESFSNAATAVTRLYWSGQGSDHPRFVLAANAVGQMHRAAEQEVARAHRRGARESLRECLEWVMRQGPSIESSHLAQLLKIHIAANTDRLGAPDEVGENLEDMAGCGG